jgi:TolB-like protein
VSRTTALQLAATSRPLPELAAMVSATAAIEGTLVSEGATVRVRVRVVDGRLDRKTGVRDFTGPRDDPDGLARQIAEALSAQFRARSLR